MERKGHVPNRTCISCRTKREKGDLIRLVLDRQGRLIWDHSGNHPGRGAYVCRSRSCQEMLLKGGPLQRAFKRRGHVPIHPSFCDP